MKRKIYPIILFFLTITILITCSPDSDRQADTILSGNWKLLSTNAQNIDLDKDYYLTFKDQHIYSLHNSLGVSIVDCYQNPYDITGNRISFHHLDIPYKINFSLSNNKDTLRLISDNSIFTYLSTSEPINYDDQRFDHNRYFMGKLDNENIDEASGIVASKKNPGILWTHNDSGSKNRIFAIDYQGNNILELWLENIDLVDCEDISIMEINGNSYILLGDIGDNNAKRDDICLYLVPEMTIDKYSFEQSISLNNITRIPIQLGSSRRDAETLVTLPNNDIMILSKRERNVHVYRGNLNKLVNGTLVLDKINELPYHNIVAGDYYQPSETLIIKDYNHIYSLYINKEVLNIYSGKTLDYIPEPQGEALAWDLHGNGYFTLSEKRNISSAKLYYYPYKAYWMP